MAETPATPAPTEAAASPKPSLKKGALVRLRKEAFEGSLEALASDPELPPYVLEGPGEILALKGDYAQLRWRRPVPDVWLRLDQLEAFPG
ncbi:NAD(P)H-quinone oxidoreductase subunit O [Synechococcus sp. CBW1004]|uniref:NAD(P)H-quinone oxidoreductase subunit O n=1 Tax=Synechococcus sp. CBW1004 TaxID=1353136 RepID=UPI0018CD5521|nr:NAD(P)H-quinone oxidoreductase subunit O [Synechococcus sp. CBW1004]QPN62148.1 NAD(P)H-quinone oxidoreductase subunit O [Synechococcus sp. CBW1004]